MRNFARSLKVIAAAASVGSLALASLVLLAPGAAAGGSFDSLPPGEQKIVRALHEAQPTSSTTVNPLTLDQIAARRGDGKGAGARSSRR